VPVPVVGLVVFSAGTVDVEVGSAVPVPVVVVCPVDVEVEVVLSAVPVKVEVGETVPVVLSAGQERVPVVGREKASLAR
jgi:hypothetical protein